MNMQVLKRSRKPPQVGDIFVYRMPGFDYGFGRVIRTDVRMGPWERLLLLYFYRVFSPDKRCIPALDKRRLLMPPALLLNRALWTGGYFETVARRSLEKGDLFSVHCFEDGTSLDKRYCDEYERTLRKRTEPFCGFFAVGSEYTTDVAISEALGIEPDPETLPKKPQPAERRGLEKLVARARKLRVRASTEMKGLLEKLLNDLETLGTRHDELYDSEVRDAMNEAILQGFIYAVEDYKLPKDFGMSSSKGNDGVRKSLDKYIKAALAQAEREGICTPAHRLVVFEDLDVCSKGGEGYDGFFGSYQ